MFMYQQLEEAGGAATGTTVDVNGNAGANGQNGATGGGGSGGAHGYFSAVNVTGRPINEPGGSGAGSAGTSYSGGSGSGGGNRKYSGAAGRKWWCWKCRKWRKCRCRKSKWRNRRIIGIICSNC